MVRVDAEGGWGHAGGKISWDVLLRAASWCWQSENLASHTTSPSPSPLDRYCRKHPPVSSTALATTATTLAAMVRVIVRGDEWAPVTFFWEVSLCTRVSASKTLHPSHTNQQIGETMKMQKLFFMWGLRIGLDHAKFRFFFYDKTQRRSVRIHGHRKALDIGLQDQDEVRREGRSGRGSCRK